MFVEGLRLCLRGREDEAWRRNKVQGWGGFTDRRTPPIRRASEQAREGTALAPYPKHSKERETDRSKVESLQKGVQSTIREIRREQRHRGEWEPDAKRGKQRAL